MNYEKLTSSSGLSSASPIEGNLAALKQLFPSVVREGKVDFDALRQLLGDDVAKNDELFGLQWHGKARARRHALMPSLGTLRPCREESKNWDSTQNLYIEGDNLEVLKLLQKSYAGKVKMIYIDPPYNTGNEFVYPDDYQNGINNYLELTGQQDKFKANSETSGRYHTDWLNMMYPRLMLARELLSDDGVIFVSIDDNEVEHLKIILNDIFGKTNFIACFLWNKTSKAPTLSGKIRNKHEYILCYSMFPNIELKGKDSYNTHGPLFNSGNQHSVRIIPEKKLKCNFADGVYKAGEYGILDKKVIFHTDLVVHNGYNLNPITIEGRFKWSQPTINDYCERGFHFMYKTSSMITLYYDLKWDGQTYIAPSDIINKTECNVATNDESHDELAGLFDGIELFDHPKPVSLLKYLMYMINNPNGLFLDFFSGSGSFAQALFELNVSDGGNRKFILVQLPEPLAISANSSTSSSKTTRNAIDFLTENQLRLNICEIGKERIRRAGEKVKAEAGEAGKALDIGFRVFKLDSSNVQPWNPEAGMLNLQLESESNLRPERSSDDIFYEVLLKQGIELTEDSRSKEIAGHVVYSLGHGQYYCCFDERIGEEAQELAAGIALWHEAEDADGQNCVVYVRDSAFDAGGIWTGGTSNNSDARKTSFCLTLEQSGIMKVKGI